MLRRTNTDRGCLQAAIGIATLLTFGFGFLIVSVLPDEAQGLLVTLLVMCIPAGVFAMYGVKR